MAARTSLTRPTPPRPPRTGGRSAGSRSPRSVFPVPGGPHSSSDIDWSPSISRRSGAPGRAACCWPTSSSRVRGRIRRPAVPTRACWRPGSRRHPRVDPPPAGRRRVRPQRSPYGGAPTVGQERQADTIVFVFTSNHCRPSGDPGRAGSASRRDRAAPVVHREQPPGDRGLRVVPEPRRRSGRRPCARADLQQRRLDLGADLLGQRAAGPEAAPGRRVDRAGHVALEHDPLAPPPDRGLLHVRHRGEQRLGVRVVRPAVDQSRGRRSRRSCRGTSPRPRDRSAAPRRGRGR